MRDGIEVGIRLLKKAAEPETTAAVIENDLERYRCALEKGTFRADQHGFRKLCNPEVGIWVFFRQLDRFFDGRNWHPPSRTQEERGQQGAKVRATPGVPGTYDPSELDVVIWDSDWLEARAGGQRVAKTDKSKFRSAKSWDRLIEFAHAVDHRLAPTPPATMIKSDCAKHRKLHERDPSPHEYERIKKRAEDARRTWYRRSLRLGRTLAALLRLSSSPIREEDDGARTMCFRSLEIRFGNDLREGDMSPPVPTD
jgi:hypothetical protein